MQMISDSVVAYRNGSPICLSDVASISAGSKSNWQNGPHRTVLAFTGGTLIVN